MRVGLGSGPDNIGSFQQDAHRQLSEYQKSGRLFRCYVNPARPADAILYRDLRWELFVFKQMLALAFGGAGFGMLGLGVVRFLKVRDSQALAVANPDAPWLWKRDWADGKIISSSKTLRGDFPDGCDLSGTWP